MDPITADTELPSDTDIESPYSEANVVVQFGMGQKSYQMSNLWPLEKIQSQNRSHSLPTVVLITNSASQSCGSAQTAFKADKIWLMKKTW